jgi:prolyl 4-hydroxylase
MDERKLEVVHRKPLIFTVDNFLSEDECKLIIEKCRDKMERALIGTGENAKVSEIRTGTSYFWRYLDDEDGFQIFKKISMLLNKPGRNFDPFFQVINYGVGEEYKTHVDPSPERNRVEGIKHRKLTCLFYLNDVDGGGETEFPKLNLKIKPMRGRMIYFDNYKKDGSINYDTLHRSMPVLSGEKWAFNLWYHYK